MLCVVIAKIIARWRGSSRRLDNIFADQSQQEFLLHVTNEFFNLEHKQHTLRGLSPRANYAAQGTAACRQIWCQLLRT
jgi:hypothetical protein